MKTFLIRLVLKTLYMLDQWPRKAYLTTDNHYLRLLYSICAHFCDRINRFALRFILDTSGWPSRDRYGIASEAAFYIIQHAPKDFMRRYISLLKQAVCNGQAESSHFAMVFDRLLMHNGKQQFYGTQIKVENGQDCVWPTRQPERLAIRRASLGLSDIKRTS